MIFLDLFIFLDNFIVGFICLFLILGYAEIHYRLPVIPSYLYKKEPEIIFDLPIRANWQREIPLFLFIKDSHHFPIQTQSIEVEITNLLQSKSKLFKEVLNQSIHEKFFRYVIKLPATLFEDEGNFQISATLYFVNGQGRSKKIKQDNYRTIPHPPFSIEINNSSLPKQENWFWGDLHIHSNFTNDQVEFGAPLPDTIIAARTMGLDFVAITDHSYDLDDHDDNFLKNDHTLVKWKQFQQEVFSAQRNNDRFVIIPGEEVSVGNARQQNVHCLILNDPQYHPGDGDSAEKLRQNRPTLSLNQLMERKNGRALAIAAHPMEKPPYSQKVILNRGYWEEPDLNHPQINLLQILNGHNSKVFEEGMKLWKKLLLKGKRIGIVAGNDAHGNFNCFRQIHIPFVKMTYQKRSMLGQFRTAVRAASLSKEALLEGIHNQRALISDGPFAVFWISGKEIGEIGDTFIRGELDKIHLHLQSISEYGSWNQINLFFGDISNQEEKQQSPSIAQKQLEIQTVIDFPKDNVDYIRLEAFTENHHFCISNPIWIDKEHLY